METAAFKDNVKRAAAYLEASGHKVGHAKLLEAISQAFGERNWSTMRALLENPPSVTVPKGESAGADEAWIDGDGLMPEKEYVRTGGCKCPACGCTDVESSGLDADGPDATEEVWCNACHAQWTGHFTVSGYSGLQLGSVDPIAAVAEAVALQRRQEVIDSLVEDVRDRSREYGFSVVGFGQAQEAVENSNELLGLEASEAECSAAVATLMGR